MSFTIEKNIKENALLRQSFIDLAIDCFDLSFSDWYQNGYWTQQYFPYTIVEANKVIANVSVNIIDTLWHNQPKRYIQLGTVMTDIAYRKRGLARQLIEVVLNDYQDECDAIYLFANQSVLDFYPKFGFVKEREYQYSLSLTPIASPLKKLDMTKKEDCALLQHYYAQSNPYSALPMINNVGLLMFYCSAFLKDCVFYCEACDVVVIAIEDKDTLICLDIYGSNLFPLANILAHIASKEIKKVTCGFTPIDTTGFTVEAIDEKENTLFILKSKENIFASHQLMFPLLSHA